MKKEQQNLFPEKFFEAETGEFGATDVSSIYLIVCPIFNVAETGETFEEAHKKIVDVLIQTMVESVDKGMVEGLVERLPIHVIRFNT